jgi:hypothetical protein
MSFGWRVGDLRAGAQRLEQAKTIKTVLKGAGR